MDKEAILPWIKSFEGVNDENCPNFDSLADGHVLAMIFNQLTDDNKFNMESLLQVDTSKDDWFTRVKNLKALYNHAKDRFAAVKLTSPVDFIGIARNTKPEALVNFVSMFIVYSLKCSKKDEILKKTKALPKATQAAIKEAITMQKTKPAAPAASQSASESTPAKSVPQTPTKTASNTETPEMRTQRIKLEIELKRLENEKNALISENSDLKNERDRIKNLNANAKPKSSDSSSSAKIAEITATKKQKEDEIQALDNEIASLEQFNEQKNQLQAELAALNSRIQAMRKKASQAAPTLEYFKETTDPQAIKYLKDIEEAEKIIQPDYIKKLHLILEKFNKEVSVALSDVDEKVELLGGPQMLTSQPESPSKDDGSEIKKIDDNNDVSTSLSNDIDALTERNNQLNEEIMELMVRAEAIEKMKNQHSFLEHIRSSSVFMKPE